MPSFLTAEWFDAVATLEHGHAAVPTPPQLRDVRVDLTVTGGPRGDVAAHLGPAPGGLGLRPAHLGDAPVHLHLPFDVARAMFVDQDLTVAMAAFEDGSLRVEGDQSQLFVLEQATSDNPLTADLQRSIREVTDESVRRGEDEVAADTPVVDPDAYVRVREPSPVPDDDRPDILLITTDQQRWDSLGINGNTVVSTPNIDGLLRGAIRYDRAHVQNVLCTPSRSTILTGQHPGTHGVWSNGVALPQDAPSVAEVLAEAGYATGHIGKQHFEPANTLGAYLTAIAASDETWTGPYRGFDHVESADHFHATGTYAAWLRDRLGTDGYRAHMEELMGSWREPGGDTDAPQAAYSELPAELHSSAWVVDRTEAWLASLPSDRPFFGWVSFDDPHHPFNPPAAYGRRHDWRDLPLPPGRPPDRAAIERDLAGKPWQYGAYWRGEFSRHEGSTGIVPAALSDDQVRELVALTYGMIELIDENVGRLLAALDASGRRRETHVVFTSDHGELLGDHGLVLKGPFHVDSLLRVALAWRAPGRDATVVTDPVGLVDLAPTFCRIAGVEPPAWMEGSPLPVADGTRERVLTVFDSAYRPELRLRTIARTDRVLTAYPRLEGVGELYDLHDDPHQLVNLWDDPVRRSERDGLLADLVAHLREDHRDPQLRWWQHA